jgi:hypothetical protein
MPVVRTDPLSQTDRELERKLRSALSALKANPLHAVPREDALWLLGAVLAQRDRIGVVLRQAHAELEQAGLGDYELMALLKQYATIGHHH